MPEIINGSNPDADAGTPPPQAAAPATPAPGLPAAAPTPATPQTPVVPTSQFQPTPPQTTLQQGPGQTPQGTQPVQQQPLFQPATPAASFHARLFDGILKNLGGSDIQVMQTDPTTGQSQLRTIQQPRSQFAKNIVAAALTGLFQKPQYVETKFGPVPSIGADLASGFQAGQNLVVQRQQRAQQLSDDQRTQAMQTVENNLKLHMLAQSSSLADYKSGEDMVKAQSTALDGYLQAEKDRNTSGPNPDPQLVFEQKQTADQAMAILQKKENFGTKQAVIDGITTGPDGKPMYTYTIVASNVDVPMNSRLQEALTALNPDYAKLAPGTKVPLYLVQRAANMEAGAADAATQLSKYLPKNVFNEGEKPSAIDTDSILKLAQQDYNIRKALDTWEQHRAAGMGHVDAAGIDKQAGPGAEDDLDALLRDPLAKGLLEGLGINEDKANKYIQDERNPRIAARTLATQGGMGDKAPAAQAQVDALITSIDKNPNLSESDKRQLRVDVPSQGPDGKVRMNQGQVEKLTGRIDQVVATNKGIAEKNALAQGDPTQLAATASNTIEGDVNDITKIAGMRGNARMNALNAIHDEAANRGLDTTRFSESALQSQADMQKDYESDKKGSSGAQIGSFNTYLQHVQSLLNAEQRLQGKTLGLTHTPVLNMTLEQIGNQLTDDPDWKAYQAAISPVKQELDNFLANGFAPKEDVVRTTDALLNTKTPLRQAVAAVRQMAETGDARLASIGQRYVDVMSRTYPTLMSTDSRNTLNRLGIQSKAAPLSVQLPRGWTANHQSSSLAANPTATALFKAAAGGNKDLFIRLARMNGWQ
jgi:hypothetical protein